MNMRGLLRRKIAAIKLRLAELAKVDVGESGSRTFKQQEAASELSNLKADLGWSRRQLDEASDLERRSAARERQEQFCELLIANRIDTYRRWADELDRQSDHRQARIYREAIPGIPMEVYRQEGLVR